MPWSLRQMFAPPGSTKPDSTSPSTRFAFKFFAELAQSMPMENLLFSPSSLILCLALVQELASGETRQAMASALEFAGLDRAQIDAEIVQIKATFGERPAATLAFGNSVWLSHHVHIAKELENRLRVLYGSELATADFSSPEIVATINAWVKAKTNGKIAGIVDQLSPLSALVAVNAVYLRARWEQPFLRALTKEAPFQSVSGPMTPCSMMEQRGTYSYYEDQYVQLVALPYLGNISMHVLLPAPKTNVQEFRQHLGSGAWEALVNKMTRECGSIKLPRFKVDFKVQLKEVLTSLGMGCAFDQARAEFANVATNGQPVWVDQVIHHAFAEVNEEGTVAAAASGATMPLTARAKKPPRIFQMIIDRPFFFAIRDEQTKVIQFVGWVGEPQ
jgi:serine protease inhibitor